MIDTHAHIYSNKFLHDREDMLKKTFESGVHKIFMPNIDRESIDGMLALEAAYPNQCYAMMGLHPCSVDANFEKELALVEEWLQKRAFVAIGEMGIDLYWDKTYFEEQKEAFRIQAAWAKQYKKPLVIHTRNSMTETIALLTELNDDDLFGIVHCFGGTLEEANQIIELGFLLGIGGVATFKNGGLDKVLPHIDLAHLVLETDSPYLAPKPYRGKRNEPSYIPLIAQRIADLKEVSVDFVSEVTDRNALKVFGLLEEKVY
ncbi:MAG: TatD family hydrolase [Flammeovirgaceae bacterium]